LIPDQIFKCKDCSKEFPTNKKLTDHKRQHKRVYCLNCGKSLNSKYLKVHKITCKRKSEKSDESKLNCFYSPRIIKIKHIYLIKMPIHVQLMSRVIRRHKIPVKWTLFLKILFPSTSLKVQQQKWITASQQMVYKLNRKCLFYKRN
jgi:hypothetical protein